ncbi:uncharacterized protein LOC109282916 [Alligator mississippiensis]|nr:uncharacterized protein LOC109282916 [Alligator mississippiensis]
MLLQASMLEATGGAEETAGWTEGDAPAEAVSDLGTVGVVSAPGAKAAPSWAEGDVTCSLPAAVNEEAKELMPRQTSGATDGTSGWLQVLLAAAVRLAWGSASGLWRILRKALALLLQWALVLRSRLRRALAALAKKGSSNVQPPAGTPQDAQPVGLPERTQSSSDAVSHQEHTASSEEEGESVEQSTRAERRGTGDWFAPGWEGLSATTDPGQPRSQDPSTSEEEK